MRRKLVFLFAIVVALCGVSRASAADKKVKFDFSNEDQIVTEVSTKTKTVWKTETTTFTIEPNTSTYLSAPLRIYKESAGTISAGEGLYFKKVVIYGNSSKKPSATNMTWTNATVTAADAVLTLTPSADNVSEIAYTTSAQVRIDSIVCTLSGACTEPAENLTVTPDVVSLEVGESLKVMPKGGNGGAVIYASSDESVASVSADGLITALKKGTTTIIVTQAQEGDYCSQSAEVSVTVSAFYTVTWQTPYGSTASKVEKDATIGAAYPADEVTSCNVEEYPYFAGWITENVGKEGGMSVEFITPSVVPTSDVTYYAAFADEAKVQGASFSCEGNLASITANGGSQSNCESYNSGSYTIKMATDGASITVPVTNPETATFKYSRRGGAVSALVEVQYTVDNKIFTTLEKWDVGGSQTTNTITCTNTNAFPQGTIGVRFVYKKTTGNIAVGPITVTAANAFPPATIFITACCDEWTTTPNITLDKTTLDAETGETLSVTAVNGVPTDFAGSVSYASSNTAVATVDASTGTAIAQSAGKFRLIATWNGDEKYCDKSIASEEITVTGKVSVVYNKNSEYATGDMPTQKFDVDSKITLAPCQFVRTGYHFVGWAEKADGNKLWNDGDELILTSGKQLYAVWEIDVYEVTKGAEENGTFTLSATSAEYGGRIVVTKTPAANYKNGTVSVVPADAATVDNDTVKNIAGDITINVTFEEKTKYAMTWHSGNTTVTTWVYEGDALGTLPEAASSCDVDNHPEFYGWCATEYGSYLVPKTEAPTLIDANMKPTGNADFYAVYSNGVMGGGQKMTALSVGDKVVMVAVDSIELGGILNNIGQAEKYNGTPNGVYPLNVVAGATPASFAFEHDGKYLCYTGSSNSLSEADAVNSSSSWTVSFSDNNAIVTNVGTSSRSIYYNASQPRFAAYKAEQKPIQFMRAGQSATEWMTACCTPQPFEVRNAIILLDDIIAEATATINVSTLVAGDGNGGEKHYRLADVYADATLTGNVFSSTAVGRFTVIVSQDAQGDVCGNEYEIVIVVEPKNSTITFDANADDATGIMAPITAETLTKQTLTANSFAKVGYHFVAWNTKPDGTGTAFADGAEAEMHNMTLYAQWEINRYQIVVSKVGDGEVVLPSEAAHGDTLVVKTTPAAGYKLGAITITPTENATISGDSIKNIVGDITVGVTFEQLASFKVVYRDANNAAIYEEIVYEGSFANPALSAFGCARMPLVGFSNEQIPDNSATFDAVDVTTAVIDRDTTFWAVYGLYKGAGRHFDPNTTKSGNFKIYAAVDGVEKFAAELANKKILSTENAADANIYTFEQVSAGVYTIKQDGKYVNYKSGTDLELSSTPETWAISQGVKGSWRVTVASEASRALIFCAGTTNKFGAYATSNVSPTTTYYDIEIGYNAAVRYYSTLDCSTIDVTGVNVPAHDTVCVGETKILAAEVLPVDATDKSVVWSSNNPTIATIDAATGEVKGLQQGTAVITVTTNDEGYEASCQLFVRRPVEEISLQETLLNLKDCEAGQQLHATVLPADATDKSVVWSSSNESVATVDANGLVTPVAQGNAVITATTTDGGFTAECAVAVVECVKVEQLALDTTMLQFKVCENKVYMLRATVLPENAENKTLRWESADPNVATVDAGLVTPVSIGTTTITVATTDGSNLTAVCTVTVLDCENALENVEAIDGVFVRNGRIVVECNGMVDVCVYNALGQIVAAKTNAVSFEFPVPQGVYVVAVGNKSQKIVVR